MKGRHDAKPVVRIFRCGCKVAAIGLIPYSFEPCKRHGLSERKQKADHK